MEVFGDGDEVLDAEYAEVDPTGRYMRVSSFNCGLNISFQLV